MPSNDNNAEALEKRKKVELEISYHFIQILQRKLDLLRTRGTDGTKFTLDPAERDVLLKINNFGLVEGVVAGGISLLFLRRIRGHFLRRMYERSRSNVNNNTNVTHNINSPFHNNANNTNTTNFTSVVPNGNSSSAGGTHFQHHPEQNLFFRVFGWIIDLGGAFSVSAFTSFAFSDVNKLLNELERLPLVPGQSRVAAEFCPEIDVAVREARRKAEENGGGDYRAALEDPQSDYLKALMMFYKNCSRRQAYETRLRQEKGVGPDYPVSIPLPGVPADYEDPTTKISDEWDDNSSNLSDDDFFDPWAEDNSNSKQDGEWADAMVTDMEDQRRRD